MSPADAVRALLLLRALPAARQQMPDPVYLRALSGFDKPPHLWGGFAEYVYVDLDMLPGTKVYKLPTNMPLRLERYQSR